MKGMDFDDLISRDDRLTLLEILYPTLAYDLLFYPDMTDSVLDGMNIPKERASCGVTVITGYPELKKAIDTAIKNHIRMGGNMELY